MCLSVMRPPAESCVHRQLFNEVVMSEETRILGSSMPFVDLVPDGLVQTTVPFHSIRQSRVTGPQKSTKCHDGHGHFGEVTKSFLDSKKKKTGHRLILRKKKKKTRLPDENLYLSRSFQPPDETIFSSGASRVTVADELIEMVQYNNFSTNTPLFYERLSLQ